MKLNISLTIIALFAGLLALTDATVLYDRDLTLHSLASASSTSTTGTCANNTCSPAGAVDNFNDPDATAWISNPSPTCAQSEYFHADWNTTIGPVKLGVIRFQFGDRASNRATLSYVQPDGVLVPTTIGMVGNDTDHFYYFNMENAGLAPVATGVRITFTELVANNGLCYVSLLEIEGFATDGNLPSQKLSSGAIAGAVIGSIAGAVILGSASYFFYKRMHHKRVQQQVMLQSLTREA
ncbi:hypothetical protein SeMB42_g03164 [Synchytrium endobioticum]|uniref:Uncharacterized protein n=1 Tax=Synchytrium endobioticum TaxID=286115 RepID=A0A507D8U2_9FUNG|nr:hypothetical protein SeMB42_g03164 [Synchytrium endobioticum]TPX49409.1 hypothetical protein SeLEV6574_g01491 [Synchytrium endobioticum]